MHDIFLAYAVHFPPRNPCKMKILNAVKSLEDPTTDPYRLTQLIDLLARFEICHLPVPGSSLNATLHQALLKPTKTFSSSKPNLESTLEPSFFTLQAPGPHYTQYREFVTCTCRTVLPGMQAFIDDRTKKVQG